MILKVLVIIFALWVFLRLIANYQEKKIDTFNFVVWMLVWIVVVVVVNYPVWTDKVAHLLGVRRGTDIAFFVAFLLLFYLTFRLYVKINAVESDLTEVVKHIALINERLQNKNYAKEKEENKK